MNRYPGTSATVVAASLLGISIAGCASSRRSDSTPPDWRTLDVMRVVAVERAVSFGVPPDMKEIPAQGVDSLVRSYRSPTIELSLDYGRHSDPLQYDDKPGYSRSELTVDGRRAYMVTFDDVVALHVPSVYLLSRDRLTLFARCRDATAREQVKQLFQTVRFR